MGRRIIDDALWNLIEPLLPPAKSPSVQVSASQARAESRSADGHSVRAEDLHSLARSSCQNGMWLVRELLAAAAGLARGCSPGCISRVAVDQTTANPCRSSLPSRPGLRTANQYSPLWSKHVPIIATLHATFDPIMDANPATQFPCSNASPSEGRILTALPDTWKSAPVASPWDGIQVHNYQIREEGKSGICDSNRTCFFACIESLTSGLRALIDSAAGSTPTLQIAVWRMVHLMRR